MSEGRGWWQLGQKDSRGSCDILYIIRRRRGGREISDIIFDCRVGYY